MRPFVQLENGAGPASAEDSGIVIDDSDLSIEAETNGTAEAETEPTKVDAEVEAFANTAFDRLLEAEAAPAAEGEAPKNEERTIPPPPPPPPLPTTSPMPP